MVNTCFLNLQLLTRKVRLSPEHSSSTYTCSSPAPSRGPTHTPAFYHGEAFWELHVETRRDKKRHCSGSPRPSRPPPSLPSTSLLSPLRTRQISVTSTIKQEVGLSTVGHTDLYIANKLLIYTVSPFKNREIQKYNQAMNPHVFLLHHWFGFLRKSMKAIIRESKGGTSSEVFLDKQSRKKQEKTVNFESVLHLTLL